MNLLRAWKSAVTQSPSSGPATSWVLAIAGWDQGDHEAKLKRLATELGIPWADTREKAATPASLLHPQPSLLFLGPQFKDAKAACYAACDAFILPSFSEGLPMVVLEAWAYAKPVVMTPECNLPAGFAASAALKIETNVESITPALTELFRLSPTQLRTLGANGQRLVREQFTWDSIAGQLKATYEWMLGGGARPGWMYER